MPIPRCLRPSLGCLCARLQNDGPSVTAAEMAAAENRLVELIVLLHGRHGHDSKLFKRRVLQAVAADLQLRALAIRMAAMSIPRSNEVALISGDFPHRPGGQMPGSLSFVPLQCSECPIEKPGNGLRDRAGRGLFTGCTP
jgi:hypothetical protein